MNKRRPQTAVEQRSWPCVFCKQRCATVLAGKQLGAMHAEPMCRYFQELSPEQFVSASVAALRN